MLPNKDKIGNFCYAVKNYQECKETGKRDT